jgi:hypothetical protein
MNFNTVLGYKVKEERLIQLAEKYRLNTSLGFLLAVERFIQKSGFPIGRFALMRQEDDDCFVLTLYNGSKEKEEINVKEVLSKFHPVFFKLLKRDLGVGGKLQFYLAEQ